MGLNLKILRVQVNYYFLFLLFSSHHIWIILNAIFFSIAFKIVFIHRTRIFSFYIITLQKYEKVIALTCAFYSVKYSLTPFEVCNCSICVVLLLYINIRRCLALAKLVASDTNFVVSAWAEGALKWGLGEVVILMAALFIEFIVLSFFYTPYQSLAKYFKYQVLEIQSFRKYFK